MRNRVLAPAGPNLISKHNVPLSYDKAKKVALDNQPLVADFPLGNVELGRSQTIKVDGHILPLTDKAYNQFLKNVLDVHPAFVKRFKEVTDEKTELKMLETLQRGLAAKLGERVKVVANAHTQNIVGFQPKSFNYIPNSAMLVFFEQIMNQYPELQLRDMYVDESGDLTMNVRSVRTRSFGKNPTDGLEEDFNGGLTFKNSPTVGTHVGHNALRLVCSNGMTILTQLSRFNISGDAKEQQKFFAAIQHLALRGFMPDYFGENIQRAQNSDCSVSELKKCANIIRKNSTLEIEDVADYLPIQEASSFLAKRGIDYVKLTDGQARNCPTSFKLWDVINYVTHFGSHYTDHYANYGRIQAGAGGLIDRKNYDGENMVIFRN